MGCQKTCEVEKLLKQSQREAVWSQRQRLATAKKNSRMRGTDKLRNEVLPLQLQGVQRLDSFRLLEDNSRALRLSQEALSHQRLKQKLLENEIQDFLQENKHFNLQLLNNSHKASEYEKVKSEYAKLKETLGAVTQERDLALWERNQLQDKLENLEQVLKVRKPSLRAHL
ncbi:hypothetical protein GBF38_004678, partial [Nibea albiflora]